MKDDDLLKAIGGINEKYINEADLPAIRHVKQRHRFMHTIVAAAGIALVAGTALIVPGLLKNEPGGMQTLTVDEQPGDVRIMSFGIDVPKIDTAGLTGEELEEKYTSVLVYNGDVYTHSDLGASNGEDTFGSLLDQRLGSTKGIFADLSSGSSEIASNLTGDVYSLKGYGTDFRLCVKRLTGNSFEILEHLNGIGLGVGSDLFEYRLHLSELTDSVIFEAEDGKIKIDTETWNDVLDAIDSAAFEDLTKRSDITDEKTRICLTILMKDGTEVRLSLIEGGYVGYENLDGYFVRIPEETINKLYALRKGNIK